MQTRYGDFGDRFRFGCISLLAIVAALWTPQPACADNVKPIEVDVIPGDTKPTNVGCGFGDLSDDVYELKIQLKPPGRIVQSGIEPGDQSGDFGLLWEHEAGDVTKWHIAGVHPAARFWVIIWARLGGGQGGTDHPYWMSVSDLDADADTDNVSTANPRTPSESPNEDYSEYPGYSAPPTVPGLVLGVNDDHDEVLPDAQPWGRDYDNTSLDLSKEGKNYGTRSVGVAQVKVKVGVKRAPGVLSTTVPENVRLFMGPTPEGTEPYPQWNPWAEFGNTLSITTPGEKTFIFYVEGKAGSVEEQLTVKYDPEGGQGEAVDVITILPVRIDIDVDSDNSGYLEGTDEEDLRDAKPGDPGMFVPVGVDPDDRSNAKNGVLHALESNRAYILEDHDPVITLTKLSGGGDVRVWKVRAGQDPVVMLDTRVSDSTQWDGEGNALYNLLGISSQNQWIQITGLETGEVLLALDLTVNGAKVAMDVVRISVTGVRLTPCDGTWLPKGGSEDNEAAFTAAIYPTATTATIRFTLYDVSDEPGYCVNRPASVPPTGEDSDDWKDLQFKDPQSGLTISGTYKDVAVTSAPVNSATVTVKCYDYGAYGKLKAEAQIDGVWIPAYVVTPNSRSAYATIPRDEDANHIADCWAHNTGAAGDDDDTSLNNTHDGDGLTRYQEYRGVDFDGDGNVSQLERLDPNRKDLFVQGTGFGGWVPFAYGSAFSEARIDVHTFVGTVGTDDRGIDVLVVSVLDQGGHIEKYPAYPRVWLWPYLGWSGVGTATDYGAPKIPKRGMDNYFSDKPYKDGNTWTAEGVWGGPPNGVLDPLDKVEDTNDNGILDANEKDGPTTPPTDDGDDDFDGDYPVVAGASWDWGQDLNPCDIDRDGKVEVGAYEYTKPQILRHVITHEMGHGVGIDGPYDNGHCDDSTCVMYRRNDDRERDGHLCDDCRAQIRIHNQ